MSPEESAAPRVEIAIAVVERDGQFLIGQRGADVALAGYWEFPGGKIEPGESPETAAVRECLEETGLVVRVAGTYCSTEYDYAHGRLLLHFLACHCERQTGALPARFCWVERDALRKYQFPPANRPLLELLAAKPGS